MSRNANVINTLDNENRHNLTALWALYGAHSVAQNLSQTESAEQTAQDVKNSQSALRRVMQNTSWPHRCWFQPAAINSAADHMTNSRDLHKETTIHMLRNALTREAILPLWADGNAHHKTLEAELRAAGTDYEFKQTAMYLPLPASAAAQEKSRTDKPAYPLTVERIQAIGSLESEQVTRPRERSAGGLEEGTVESLVARWAAIGSDAFAYHIDPSVILPLTRNENVQVLMGYMHGKPVASGMLYKTGSAIGVHQVAVHPSAQGQGVARALMQQLIERAHQWQGRNIVLQASESGLPLYQQLGFKTLFEIRNYRLRPAEGGKVLVKNRDIRPS